MDPEERTKQIGAKMEREVGTSEALSSAPVLAWDPPSMVEERLADFEEAGAPFFWTEWMPDELPADLPRRLDEFFRARACFLPPMIDDRLSAIEAPSGDEAKYLVLVDPAETCVETPGVSTLRTLEHTGVAVFASLDDADAVGPIAGVFGVSRQPQVLLTFGLWAARRRHRFACVDVFTGSPFRWFATGLSLPRVAIVAADGNARSLRRFLDCRDGSRTSSESVDPPYEARMLAVHASLCALSAGGRVTKEAVAELPEETSGVAKNLAYWMELSWRYRESLRHRDSQERVEVEVGLMAEACGSSPSAGAAHFRVLTRSWTRRLVNQLARVVPFPGWFDVFAKLESLEGNLADVCRTVLTADLETSDLRNTMSRRLAMGFWHVHMQRAVGMLDATDRRRLHAVLEFLPSIQGGDEEVAVVRTFANAMLGDWRRALQCAAGDAMASRGALYAVETMLPVLEAGRTTPEERADIEALANQLERLEKRTPTRPGQFARIVLGLHGVGAGWSPERISFETCVPRQPIARVAMIAVFAWLAGKETLGQSLCGTLHFDGVGTAPDALALGTMCALLGRPDQAFVILARIDHEWPEFLESTVAPNHRWFLASLGWAALGEEQRARGLFERARRFDRNAEPRRFQFLRTRIPSLADE